MVTLLVLTSSFPYYPGEWFIEEEIKYWKLGAFDRITILPRKTQGLPRSLPEGIELDLSLSTSSKKNRLTKTLCSALSPNYLFTVSLNLLFKEIKYLISSKNLHLINIKQAVIYILLTAHAVRMLRKHIDKNGTVTIAYSYWNATESYAACILKRRGYIRKVVTRAHGTDLYESRRHLGYMPLKRQFVEDFDTIYTISDEGLRYYSDTYQPVESKLKVSALGVSISAEVSERSDENCLHFLSVARCVPIKRIDKIISALAIISNRNPSLSMKWTHIGGGELLEDHIAHAKHLLTDIVNIEYEFKGDLSNTEVKAFYQLNSIDIFLNTSDSEGVPVSIMEAMSMGVPAIAPDVGGITSLVTPDCGVLMNLRPDEEEIATAIEMLISRTDTDVLRCNAKRRVCDHFNAQKNYTKFIRDLYHLAVS